MTRWDVIGLVGVGLFFWANLLLLAPVDWSNNTWFRNKRARPPSVWTLVLAHGRISVGPACATAMANGSQASGYALPCWVRSVVRDSKFILALSWAEPIAAMPFASCWTDARCRSRCTRATSSQIDPSPGGQRAVEKLVSRNGVVSLSTAPSVCRDVSVRWPQGRSVFCPIRLRLAGLGTSLGPTLLDASPAGMVVSAVTKP